MNELAQPTGTWFEGKSPENPKNVEKSVVQRSQAGLEEKAASRDQRFSRELHP
jgi:hypothetical protein